MESSPCHAQFQYLFQIGFQSAGTIPNRHKVRSNREILRGEILERNHGCVPY
jgi:hypothetical protein